MLDLLLEGLSALAWTGDAWVLAIAAVASVLAGVVRGFAGFGYSALVMAALTPFVTPGPLVISIQLLEAAASLRLLRHVAGQVDREWLRSVVVGNLLFVPVGAMALFLLPQALLKVVVGLLLLVGAMSVKWALVHEIRATSLLRGSAGAGSGILNGIAGAGGVVAAMMMAATAVPAAVLRATMVSVLLWISLYTLAWATGMSVWTRTSALGVDTLRWVLVLWPTMMLGMRMGHFTFANVRPGRQQALVLNILILTAAAGLATSMFRMLAAP